MRRLRDESVLLSFVVFFFVYLMLVHALHLLSADKLVDLTPQVSARSANDLEDHIQKINKMIVDFNEGKLIPEEGAGM